MICSKCKKDFEEYQLDESHDVPCYMFPGVTRKERKQLADKHGRRYLCKSCHSKYEWGVVFETFKYLPEEMKEKIRQKTKEFAEGYF